MNQKYISGSVGGLFALAYLAYGSYHAVRISKGFSFTESLLPELITVFIVLVPLMAPALLLLFRKNTKQFKNWVYWLYPVILGLGLSNVFIANDPIAAGLPMVLLVIPFCLIYAGVLAFSKK